jgi:hypothetical protein
MDAERRLTQTDSILEPNVVHHLKQFIAQAGSSGAGGNPARVRDAIDLVSKSYRGVPQMVNLLADLLVSVGDESNEQVEGIISGIMRKMVHAKFDANLVDQAMSLNVTETFAKLQMFNLFSSFRMARFLNGWIT